MDEKSKSGCIHEEENMDMLFRVMDDENDVTLTDREGIVLRVSDSYEKHFAVTRSEVIGKSVFDLEREGVFSPSVTAIVLKKKRKATIMQTNKEGLSFLTTGVPIFDDEGNIQYVISFNSIDIAGMTTLHEKYMKLSELMRQYSAEMNLLKMREIKEKEIIAKSKSMMDINELIFQVADTNANVLITGETGVGKSMIAKIVHENSNRAQGPFIEINCGTIPPNLIESELFGYESGSFTGANHSGKIGKIERANEGTLFLDEIGELPLDMQIKFLQVIQEKVITRIGGLDKINVDFRLIAATNRDLKSAVRKEKFREDLFYRLNVIPLHVPALRERTEDIIPLIVSFLERFNKRYHKNVSFDEKIFEILERQSWPGNIRQVENLVERLVVTSKESTISIENLPSDIVTEVYKRNIHSGNSLSKMMEDVERHIFIDAFRKYKTSISVGQALGISQATAARKLRKYIPNYAFQREK